MAKANIDDAEREAATSEGELLTDEDILALIDKACSVQRCPPRERGEYTVYEMATSWDISLEGARARLKRAVRIGTMYVHKAKIGSAALNVYGVVK
jgi:hypothetical protein